MGASGFHGCRQKTCAFSFHAERYVSTPLGFGVLVAVTAAAFFLIIITLLFCSNYVHSFAWCAILISPDF